MVRTDNNKHINMKNFSLNNWYKFIAYFKSDLIMYIFILFNLIFFTIMIVSGPFNNLNYIFVIDVLMISSIILILNKNIVLSIKTINIIMYILILLTILFCINYKIVITFIGLIVNIYNIVLISIAYLYEFNKYLLNYFSVLKFLDEYYSIIYGFPKLTPLGMILQDLTTGFSYFILKKQDTELDSYEYFYCPGVETGEYIDYIDNEELSEANLSALEGVTPLPE